MSIVDPPQLTRLRNLSFPDILLCVARLPGTERLFYGSSDSRVYEIDLTAKKPQPSALVGAGHDSYVTGLARCGHRLVSGSYDGRLIWWDIKSRRQTRTVAAHDRWIRRVVASPDGHIIATVADDMVGKLWDAESGQLLRVLRGHERTTPNHYPSMLYAVAFSADGKRLATGDKLGHVLIWDVATGRKIGEVDAPVMYTWDPRQRRHSIGGIRSVAFSRDGRLLAAGGIGTIGNIDHLGGPSRIEVFDWKAGKRLHVISDDKFKGLVEQIAFSPDDEWFAAIGGDHKGFVSLYETATGRLIVQQRAAGHLHGGVFSENWDTLETVGHHLLSTWDLARKPSPPVRALKAV